MFYTKSTISLLLLTLHEKLKQNGGKHQSLIAAFFSLLPRSRQFVVLSFGAKYCRNIQSGRVEII